MRPRVCICAGGIARLLEEEVAELLVRSGGATVWLVGPAGAGKSTALAHLAAVFAGHPRLRLWDDGPFVPGDGMVDVKAVAAASNLCEAPGVTVWRMAPWSDDDCLEYLQARHPGRVVAAFAAWRAATAEHDLLAWPGLCSEVLDLLAGDVAPADPLQALRTVLTTASASERGRWGMAALRRFLRPRITRAEVEDVLAGARPRQLLRSRTAGALLAADVLVALASGLLPFPMESLLWDRDLAIAIMVVLQQDTKRAERLVAALRSDGDGERRLALSLLAVAQHGYRPESPRLAYLAHAWLESTDLRDKVLEGDCRRVHLAHANLQRATLDGCRLTNAALTGADLTAASMRLANCAGATGDGLRATDLHAEGACFAGARLEGAQLQRARLAGADLSGAVLSEADLSGADLAAASLALCDLRTTRWGRANLHHASLHRVQGAGAVWTQLAATGADWSFADLTGSQLRRARLQCGVFRGCGLAHVDWQGADLRGADFTGATFHLGNARSGLVGSDIAGEGSRTGFYTDESLEEHWKQPELVRKANLQDCDLRGAKLDGVDLYLVDLRGARLDAEQRVWAKRCRALLDGEQSA